jgi:hypothetical protein
VFGPGGTVATCKLIPDALHPYFLWDFANFGSLAFGCPSPV